MTRVETDPRTVNLDALRREPRTQVLVVGGGINGAAVFRDLALQGIDCVIVDKGDWCAGTSAAPSRLIHGGLKYLETGEFRLVAESTHERNLLLKNAPHFVHPLESVVPISSYFGGTVAALKRFLGRRADLADRGLLIVEIGMALYDLFGARDRVMPRHGFALRGGVRRRFPHMNPAFVAASTYYDARVSQAERLGFELVDDGCRAHPGARAFNYLAVSGFSDGQVELTDTRSGARLTVEPAVVVNAAGPWIDRVNGALATPTAYIGGAKGSHLILDNPALVAELAGRMIYFGSSDGRVCLVYPFFGHALVGSTDIPFDDPDAVSCDGEEADYMLGVLREVFPGLAITPDQVIYRYAGVRPLPQAQSARPGEVTRDHSLPRDRVAGGAIPVLSMIGGKWTTFRAFGAETADAVLGLLGRARRRSTEREPIGGGRLYPASRGERAAWIADFAARHGLAEPRAAAWLERYGTSAERLAVAAGPAIDEPLATLPAYSRGEIGAIARDEQVVELTDIVFRRTPIALAGLLTHASLAEIGRIAAPICGWSAEETEREIGAALALARHHGMRLEG